MGFFDNRLNKNNKFVFLNQCFSIHGLALLVNDRKHKNKLRNSYQNIDKRLSEKGPDTEMFARILMGLHYLKALNAIPEEKVCIMSRSAIIDWYYGIYNGAQAMLYAQEKQAGSNHRKVIRQWYNSIVQNKLALHPFNLSVNSLVKTRYEKEIENHPNYQKHNNKKPQNIRQAYGAWFSYLKGTADWLRKNEEAKIKQNYKNITSFKSKQNRTKRDNCLANKKCCFLDQAFRFRGKANYRDSVFLILPEEIQYFTNELVNDLVAILEYFLEMSVFFCYRRVKAEEDFERFFNELEDTFLSDQFQNLRNLLSK